MAAAQLSGQSLGNFSLAAGGQSVLPFNTLLAGAYSKFHLILGFSLKSTGSAFNLVVDTAGSAAAEGVDDMDLVLNTIFTNLNIYYDAASPMFIGHTLPQARTVLDTLNQRDFDGGMTNGTQVPASGGSALAFTVVVVLPMNLKRYLRRSGQLFQQGSARLYDGRAMITSGANITNPNVTLANGIATVTNITASLYAFGGIGSAGDIGNTWQSERVQGQPTVPQLDSRVRLAILDFNPAATNAVANYQINSQQLMTPANLQAVFQSERLYAGGMDITARCTPVVWVHEDTETLELGAIIGQPNFIQLVSGASSFSYYDLTMGLPSQTKSAQVAQQIGAGGPTVVSRPSPLPPGTQVPGGLSGVLPIRVQPPIAGAGGAGAQKVSTPSGVQQKVAAGHSRFQQLQSNLTSGKSGQTTRAT